MAINKRPATTNKSESAVTGTASALATAAHPTSIVAQTDAEREFLQYQTVRDSMLESRFAKKTVIARACIPFTITEASTRVQGANEALDRDEEEQFVYLIILGKDYEHTDNIGKVTQYKAGDQQVLAIGVNDIRSGDHSRIVRLLSDHGAIPNLTLQEYPSRKPGQSNPYGIVHVSTWKPVAQLAKERGLI
jgi:hypothetical protein